MMPHVDQFDNKTCAAAWRSLKPNVLWCIALSQAETLFADIMATIDGSHDIVLAKGATVVTKFNAAQVCHTGGKAGNQHKHQPLRAVTYCTAAVPAVAVVAAIPSASCSTAAG
jgi:hypothetical protein